MIDPARTPMVVFGEDWGRHPSSTQHLVARLCANRPVVWVNSLGMRRPRLDLRDLRRVTDKLSRMAGKGRMTSEREDKTSETCRPILIVEPKSISWPGSLMADTWNRAVVGRQVRKALSAFPAMTRPIAWLSLPTALPVLHALDPAFTVYYAGDDFSALEGVDHGPVVDMERKLAERADIIIAASVAIAERFSSGKTVVVPHGADVSRFSTPCPEAADLRPDPSDHRPIAGFYGSLSGWLDQDLIVATARALPHWRFVFIGTASCDVSRLRAEPNVVLLGPRPHSALPGYAQHWNASIIPFLDNAQIRACNPLKLREYLAAGSAVVSTDFPAATPYRAHLRLANDAATFAAALDGSLAEGEDIRSARRASVQGESWEARAHMIESLLAQVGGWHAPAFEESAA